VLAGVRGSRTHLPRSSRGTTDLKSVKQTKNGYTGLAMGVAPSLVFYRRIGDREATEKLEAAVRTL